MELHQPGLQPFILLAQHRITTNEIGFGGLHGKAQPGLQHVVFAGDIMAEMAESFFDSGTVHHMHAAKLKTHVLPGLPKGFKHITRHLGADINLPPQFAHIRHAMHPGEAKAQLDLLRRTKGVSDVGEIIGRHLLQQRAGVRPHHRQYAFRRSDISDGDPRVPLSSPPEQPSLIRQPRRRRGDHQIDGFRQAGHGYIRLNPAAAVEELGIDDLAQRH